MCPGFVESLKQTAMARSAAKFGKRMARAQDAVANQGKPG